MRQHGDFYHLQPGYASDKPHTDSQISHSSTSLREARRGNNSFSTSLLLRVSAAPGKWDKQPPLPVLFNSKSKIIGVKAICSSVTLSRCEEAVMHKAVGDLIVSISPTMERISKRSQQCHTSTSIKTSNKFPPITGRVVLNQVQLVSPPAASPRLAVPFFRGTSSAWSKAPPLPTGFGSAGEGTAVKR